MNDVSVVRLLLVVIAVVILMMFVNEYNKQRRSETFVAAAAAQPTDPAARAATESQFFRDQPTSVSEMLDASKVTAQKSESVAAKAAAVMPSEEASNEDYRAVDFDVKAKTPSTCFPQDETRIEDLLPKDAANSLWAQVNPAGQGDVKDQNLLTAGYHMGVDTIGQSRKNPSYQLRSEPPNPRVNVSIWNNSTIEYDSNRRPFELGQC